MQPVTLAPPTMTSASSRVINAPVVGIS